MFKLLYLLYFVYVNMQPCIFFYVHVRAHPCYKIKIFMNEHIVYLRKKEIIMCLLNMLGYMSSVYFILSSFSSLRFYYICQHSYVQCLQDEDFRLIIAWWSVDIETSSVLYFSIYNNPCAFLFTWVGIMFARYMNMLNILLENWSFIL